MKRRHFVKGMGVYLPVFALPLSGGLSQFFSKTGVEPAPPACKPSCYVDQTLAKKREANFLSWKKPWLDGTCSGSNENIFFPVKPANFVSMLNDFAVSGQSGNAGPAYNGMRMYFASPDQGSGSPADMPPDQAGKLTVLFVPTKMNKAYGDIGGDDDLNQCRWLYDQKAYAIPGDVAKRWVFNYRGNKRCGMNGLDAHGPAQSFLFADTNSIWYKMATLAGTTVGTPDCGMITYIQNGINDGSITGMQIAFGAYDTTESGIFPVYQLLAQFDLLSGSKIHYLGSATTLSLTRRRHRTGELLFDGTADTGLPCPPATPCNGSGL
jgi:hypothetical protein